MPDEDATQPNLAKLQEDIACLRAEVALLSMKVTEIREGFARLDRFHELNRVVRHHQQASIHRIEESMTLYANLAVQVMQDIVQLRREGKPAMAREGASAMRQDAPSDGEGAVAGDGVDMR